MTKNTDPKLHLMHHHGGGVYRSTPPTPSGLIFAENFDSQPDWHSGLMINDLDSSGMPDRIQRTGTHTFPNNWYSVRQDPVWSPSTGHPDRHESIEILAANADKARGGVGKSYVSYRDCYPNGSSYWSSDSILCKYLPEGYSELYVEFWICFGPNWTRELAGMHSKFFRIASWNGEPEEFQAFGGGNLGPIAIALHTITGYGVRNFTALRGGPHGDNYVFDSSDIINPPPHFVSGSSGDWSLNWSDDVQGRGLGGSNPQIPNRVSGGFLPPTGTILHDQVFGPAQSWTKMGFYVKMNSAPGVQDGIFRQWLNDLQVMNITGIPWIRPSATENENAKWNLVEIGGNTYCEVADPAYEVADRRQEWYAIDDLKIYSSIPSGPQQ